MYHTPALAAIFAGLGLLGAYQKDKNNLEQLPVWVSLCPSSSLPPGHFVLAFLPSFLAALSLTF